MNTEQTLIILRKMMTTEGKAEVLTMLSKYIHTAGVITEGIDKIKPSIDLIHTTTKVRKSNPLGNSTFDALFGGGMNKHPLGDENDNDKDVRNIAKQLSTLLKIQKQQQQLLANISAIMIVYITAESMHSDACITMIKMGQGDEAVKADWESKQKG